MVSSGHRDEWTYQTFAKPSSLACCTKFCPLNPLTKSRPTALWLWMGEIIQTIRDSRRNGWMNERTATSTFCKRIKLGGLQRCFLGQWHSANQNSLTENAQNQNLRLKSYNHRVRYLNIYWSWKLNWQSQVLSRCAPCTKLQVNAIPEEDEEALVRFQTVFTTPKRQRNNARKIGPELT